MTNESILYMYSKITKGAKPKNTSKGQSKSSGFYLPVVYLRTFCLCCFLYLQNRHAGGLYARGFSSFWSARLRLWLVLVFVWSLRSVTLLRRNKRCREKTCLFFKCCFWFIDRSNVEFLEKIPAEHRTSFCQEFEFWCRAFSDMCKTF